MRQNVTGREQAEPGELSPERWPASEREGSSRDLFTFYRRRVFTAGSVGLYQVRPTPFCSRTLSGFIVVYSAAGNRFLLIRSL